MHQPVKGNCNQTADQGADKAVSAALQTAAEGAAHAENCADAGKACIAVDDRINDRNDRSGYQRFDRARSNAGKVKMRMKFRELNLQTLVFHGKGHSFLRNLAKRGKMPKITP